MNGSTAGRLRVPTPRVSTFASLGSRDFRYLWLGVLSMIAGQQMQMVVRGYLTYEITGSGLKLGLVNSGYAIPMLAFALVGGALADRVKKKQVIQICQAVGGVTAALLGLAVSTGTITWVHLLVASVLNGFIFAFMVPARTALIPRIVSETQVSNALALNSAAMSVMTLVAPAMGGVLYSVIGPDGVLYLVAAVEFAAAAFTGCIRAPDEPSKDNRDGVMRRIALGLAYIRRTPPLTTLILVGLATSLLVLPYRSLLPVLIVDVFARGPETLGLFLSVMGIGAIGGSLWIASVGANRRGAILLAGGLISGASLLIASFFPSYAVVLVVMLMLGISDAIRRSLNMALLIEGTEAEFQGRVSSVYTMNFGLMPLGTLPAGALAEAYGVPATSFVLGIALIATCAFVMLACPRIRRLQ